MTTCDSVKAKPGGACTLTCNEKSTGRQSAIRGDTPIIKRVFNFRYLLYRSLNETVAQSKNFPFGVNITTELKKNMTPKSDNNGT